MSELRDKRVLVTGAGSGIGAAAARSLLAGGARVHATSRDAQKVEALLREEGVESARLTIEELDVTDASAVADVIAHLGDEEPLDALVCVAGTNIRNRALDELDRAGWEEVVTTNLTGVFSCVSAALPQLRATRGHVVVVASVSALWPDISGPAYQASKAGVLAFTRAAALEEREHGVRFTSILPGVVATNLLTKRPVAPPAEVVSAALAPDDVAAAIVFALSLPARACVAELTILPSALQSIGQT